MLVSPEVDPRNRCLFCYIETEYSRQVVFEKQCLKSSSNKTSGSLTAKHGDDVDGIIETAITPFIGSKAKYVHLKRISFNNFKYRQLFWAYT